jgi:hypothetical protein
MGNPHLSDDKGALIWYGLDDGTEIRHEAKRHRDDTIMQCRVLIADDRPRSRSGLRALLDLRPEIAVVGEAADGREAVRLAEELRPDVVLMDVKMPVMDGLQATRIIKERWPVKKQKGEMKMSEKKTKPSGWIYGLAALIPVLGCLMTMVLVYQWFPGLPGTFEARMNLDNLTQVVVPGSEQITFAKSGAHAVYYEYRSVVDGIVYASSEKPPALACTLTSRATGADVGVVPDYVKTNTYSTKDRERVGVLIRSITIDRPGTYTFSCRYPDGRSQPEIVLAVGPNFVWEFLGIAARTIVTAAAGLVVLFGSGILAVVVVAVVAVRRRRSKKAAVGS